MTTPRALELDKFDALVGTWDSTATHPSLPGVEVPGTASFDWLEGGHYLIAHVPAYGDVRTFAVDRIKSVSLEKQTFPPPRDMPEDIFANSLGVNTGPAE